MKKIVALVLCLALALSLCTVAFADDLVEEKGKYQVYAIESEGDEFSEVVIANAGKPESKAAKAPKYDERNETLVDGNIAYVVITGVDNSGTKKEGFFVVVTKAEDATHFYKMSGKTTFLKELDDENAAKYSYKVTAYSNVGDKCGQYKEVEDAKFYSYKDEDGKTQVVYYVKDQTDATKVLAGGEIIKVDDADLNMHTFEKNYDDDGETVSVTCSLKSCGKTYKVVANGHVSGASLASAIGDGADGLWITGAPTADGGSDNVESAETFDAGIAVYAGMALASVAGSAVVIGKKKEF